MIGNRKLESGRAEGLLQRANDVKNPKEVKGFYRDWAASYDQHLEQEL